MGSYHVHTKCECGPAGHARGQPPAIPRARREGEAPAEPRAPQVRTPRLVVLALAVFLAASAGCTPWGEYIRNGFKVGPNYRRPPVPVAQDWIDATDQRLRRDEDVDFAHWWTVLKDPVLDRLVADSYRQNLTLREAGFRILQNRALLGIAIGSFFPQQQYAQGDYFRNAISTEAANRPFVLERFYSQYDLGFALAWELDFWGRFRRAIEAADADLDASVEDYDDVLVTLLGDVATAYVQMRILEAQIAYTQANVALQKQTLTIAKARFAGGLVTEVDVDQAQSILSQTEAQIPQLEIGLRQVNNRLCVLLGVPPEELRARMGPAPIPTCPAEVALGIPADLVRRRPDVRRAERLAAGQAARIGIAESDFYPHITLNGGFVYSAQQFRDVFNQRALQGAVGPSFQWNLLNYGRIINRVRFEDATFQQLVVSYQQTVLVAAQETEDGIVTFLQSQRQSRFMAESVTAAQKAVDIAIAQYKGGLVDFNRVSLLEQNLVTQQNLYAQAFGSIALGLVQTYRALGGGWQIRLDAAAAGAPGLGPPSGDRGPDIIPAPAPVPVPAPGAAPPAKAAASRGEVRASGISPVLAPRSPPVRAAANGPAQPIVPAEAVPMMRGAAAVPPWARPATSMPRVAPTGVAAGVQPAAWLMPTPR
ncbi:MAG: efflux transporter outer membrane subunit [Planctomycetia bacterium]|nr:efflux transporter outer membrane subunit [Planctomycetia bacterium]